MFEKQTFRATRFICAINVTFMQSWKSEERKLSKICGACSLHCFTSLISFYIFWSLRRLLSANQLMPSLKQFCAIDGTPPPLHHQFSRQATKTSKLWTIYQALSTPISWKFEVRFDWNDTCPSFDRLCTSFPFVGKYLQFLVYIYLLFFDEYG